MPDKNAKKKADELLKVAYKQFYSSIYKYCITKLKYDQEAAEDCVHDAFLVLYNKYLSGEEVEFPHAFLLKSASNFIKKRYNSIKRDEVLIDIEEIKEIPSQNEDIDERLSFEEYSRMISAALNDTDREIFSLRYIEELKIEDIADRLDMTIPNITTRLSRMRNKLRKLFDTDNLNS